MLAAKLLQSCPTLCDPIDSSPPGSTFPGILQARTLEWVAISFSSAWKWKVKVKSLSRVRLPATSGTAAHQAPLSMGFTRQEYWSGVPLPSPWCLLDLNSLAEPFWRGVCLLCYQPVWSTMTVRGNMVPPCASVLKLHLFWDQAQDPHCPPPILWPHFLLFWYWTNFFLASGPLHWQSSLPRGVLLKLFMQI